LLAVLSTLVGVVGSAFAQLPANYPPAPNASRLPNQIPQVTLRNPTRLQSPPNAPRGAAILPNYEPGTASNRLLPYRSDERVTPQLAQLPASPARQQNRWPAEPTAKPEPPEKELFELAETVARVGDQDIYRGDLVGEANIILEPYLAKLPPEEREKAGSQIAAQRQQLVKQALSAAVQRKLMFQMFLRSIPAEKLQEAKANIAERVAEDFAEKLDKMIEKVKDAKPEEYRSLARQSAQLFRLAQLMKEKRITTLRELDLVLRGYGSSLHKQHQAYAEDQLGRQEMYSKAREVKEVTYDDMVTYYQENIDDFRVATRARWEQITVRFDAFPTKFACGDEIAKLANEVFYGAPFQAVAKRSSGGSQAQDGGYHDWTDWGDFNISREINDAVFSLPTGKLSQIIEDPEGLHIVRVMERQDAHVIPFIDAQATITEQVEAKRRTKAINEYLARIQDEIPVWTIYDDPEETEQIANPPRTRDDRLSR
jgi:parvulin-like peptidyl-prolyl isomerase